jgi:acetyl-CoA carboxylase carboxyl transferase subunit alpha
MLAGNANTKANIMLQEYLDFENPIAEFDEKIDGLRRMSDDKNINVADEIASLEKKSKQTTKQIFAKLTPKQIVQLARHPLRPHTKEYINLIFDDFDELFGDRSTSAAHEIIAGIARLDNQPVMIIGHEKGISTKEKLYRNFGMPRPESFKRALRLMKMAEKFKLPVITFLDTPGAYPGIGAEERNQSEAIARNLMEMSSLKTPIICLVIGEGCSGGALGLGVSDTILMLQYSYYAVISPEGCASILWKSAERSAEAAEAMNLTAPRLKELGLIDKIVPEPLGGAHRSHSEAANIIKTELMTQLDRLGNIELDQLIQQRYEYWLAKGKIRN